MYTITVLEHTTEKVHFSMWACLYRNSILFSAFWSKQTLSTKQTQFEQYTYPLHTVWFIHTWPRTMGVICVRWSVVLYWAVGWRRTVIFCVLNRVHHSLNTIHSRGSFWGYLKFEKQILCSSRELLGVGSRPLEGARGLVTSLEPLMLLGFIYHLALEYQKYGWSTFPSVFLSVCCFVFRFYIEYNAKSELC